MYTLWIISGIPKSVKLCAVKKHERADWSIPGWTCFYEYNFRQRFWFPVSTLAQRLLMYYDISPGQLMPNSWRILISLTVLREKHGLNFELCSLLRSYYLKQHVHEKGRFALCLSSNATHLITDLSTNDRRWKYTSLMDPLGERSMYIHAFGIDMVSVSL
ncbi:hypothetical protein Dsin_009181 [Dipteronia sinensis]|uniref:Uncharacterized protein n=1 Tax=Dipteronia sinensis TaxID=43782 RepID=A0AAE0EBI2_9ROSI|nr:hypothetical protein Dsin_009181 [Dipteronia sinensis]